MNMMGYEEDENEEEKEEKEEEEDKMDEDQVQNMDIPIFVTHPTVLLAVTPADDRFLDEDKSVELDSGCSKVDAEHPEELEVDPEATDLGLRNGEDVELRLSLRTLGIVPVWGSGAGAVRVPRGR